MSTTVLSATPSTACRAAVTAIVAAPVTSVSRADSFPVPVVATARDSSTIASTMPVIPTSGSRWAASHTERLTSA